MNSNEIGEQGEAIFKARISVRYQFNIFFLGDKAPIVDYLLELKDNPEYCFLVQVKSTEKAEYNQNGKYLKISYENKKMNMLQSRLLPTYVAGVDVKQEIVYLQANMNSNNSMKYGISTQYKLSLADKEESEQTLKQLIDDVKNFWNNTNVKTEKSNFKSALV